MGLWEGVYFIMFLIVQAHSMMIIGCKIQAFYSYILNYPYIILWFKFYTVGYIIISKHIRAANCKLSQVKCYVSILATEWLQWEISFCKKNCKERSGDMLFSYLSYSQMMAEYENNDDHLRSSHHISYHVARFEKI